MRALIIAFVLFYPQSYGQVLKAPAPLTDSNIERKLENGSVQKFDGNEYMIVKRHAPSKPKPAPVVCNSSPTYVETTKTVETVKQLEAPRNSLLLIGGRAPVGFERDYTTVKLKQDAVIGGAYQHRFGDRYLWQLQGLSNESVLGAIGIEY